LELANLDQPILKDLIVQAPGTYHHSIIVGSLAEAAAKAINVNPLLTRVSAYYHDIGKIKKPLYFSENQGGKRNPHDKLSPSMSSLILNAHVKDGVELAKGQKLGKNILDIIQQHHGTNLISFFYQKAKVNPGGKSIDEKDFHYLGPKPQTKEAGIVMLADAVEAASKTLSEPTSSRVKGLVSQIINNIFTNGQLDDCELTLKDLHYIEESFGRILTGIFHQRVEYPDSQEEQNTSKKEGDEGTHSRSTKPRKIRRKDDHKGGPNGLKRVESPG
jgi:putative nucleotidyltransferase with HDIG domain